MSEVPPAWQAVLERAQRFGALGPGPIDRAIDHARGFLAPAGVDVPADVPEAGRCVDLGSGAGFPGLPLALAHPGTTWTLVDAWERRVDLLRDGIRALDLGERVAAVHARAEDFGRGPARGGADLVVARSFEAPARSAECGAPLLRPGGWLVVSTSPAGDEWPEQVPELGLGHRRWWRVADAGYVGYQLVGEPEERFPRRPAAQRRQPLF